MKHAGIAVLAALLAGLPGPVNAQSTSPIAGEDYIEIPAGEPLDPADGMVVVEEFFNYVCPGCNAFEPSLAAWAAELPPDVKVVYIPTTFYPSFVPYARAYYAAEAFGLVDKSHRAVYDAVHRTHLLPGERDRPDEERVAAFYANFGVDQNEFLEAMRSFSVDMKIRRGIDHMKRCRVHTTPSIVVNGRYLVSGRTYQDVLKTASFLIDKERDNLPDRQQTASAPRSP